MLRGAKSAAVASWQKNFFYEKKIYFCPLHRAAGSNRPIS
jgi:hypothetical protein